MSILLLLNNEVKKAGEQRSVFLNGTINMKENK